MQLLHLVIIISISRYLDHVFKTQFHLKKSAVEKLCKLISTASIFILVVCKLVCLIKNKNSQHCIISLSSYSVILLFGIVLGLYCILFVFLRSISDRFDATESTAHKTICQVKQVL